MTTILIWLGSGFAFAVGALVGARIMLMPSKASELSMKAHEKATEALIERNEIGRQQVEALERIAAALEGQIG